MGLGHGILAIVEDAVAKRHRTTFDFVEKKSVHVQNHPSKFAIWVMVVIVEKFFRKVTVVQNFVVGEESDEGDRVGDLVNNHGLEVFGFGQLLQPEFPCIPNKTSLEMNGDQRQSEPEQSQDIGQGTKAAKNKLWDEFPLDLDVRAAGTALRGFARP